MYKLGLKLWSNNTDAYLEEAKKLYQEGIYGYIELYVVPDTLDSLKKWSVLKNNFSIPFTLHAPHFAHGVNLAKKDYEKVNVKIFDEVKTFSKELDAKYVVAHGGMEGSIDETIRQLNIIKLENLLIENKPYIAPLPPNLPCRGATIDEIQKVLTNVNCGFCLDIGHVICTANSLKVEPYKLLKEFNELNPDCYHLSDNFIDSKIDSHMHFGDGNYDFEKIFGIINTEKNIAIETNKSSKISLDDFRTDVKFISKIKKELKC